MSAYFGEGIAQLKGYNKNGQLFGQQYFVWHLYCVKPIADNIAA